MSVNALQIHTPFLTAPLRFLLKKPLIEVKMYGSFQKLHFFRNYKPTVYTSKRQTSDWLFGKAKKASLLLQKLYLIGKNHQSGNGAHKEMFEFHNVKSIFIHYRIIPLASLCIFLKRKKNMKCSHHQLYHI